MGGDCAVVFCEVLFLVAGVRILQNIKISPEGILLMLGDRSHAGACLRSPALFGNKNKLLRVSFCFSQSLVISAGVEPALSG